MDDKLNTDLRDLPLGVRTLNCFRRYGLRTVGDVLKRNQSELMQMENFGRKSFNEVNAAFAELGVRRHWGPPRKYVSFRLDATDFERVSLLAQAADRPVEAEVERIVSEAVRGLPAVGDLATRLQRLEGAVFGIVA